VNNLTSLVHSIQRLIAATNCLPCSTYASLPDPRTGEPIEVIITHEAHHPAGCEWYSAEGRRPNRSRFDFINKGDERHILEHVIEFVLEVSPEYSWVIRRDCANPAYPVTTGGVA